MIQQPILMKRRFLLLSFVDRPVSSRDAILPFTVIRSRHAFRDPTFVVESSVVWLVTDLTEARASCSLLFLLDLSGCQFQTFIPLEFYKFR